MPSNFNLNNNSCIFRLTKILNLTANNTTEILNAFKVIRSVEIRELYAEIIEGSITNMTGIRFDIYDGTLGVDLTINGAVLSGGGVGSLIVKDEDKAETAEVLLGNTTGIIESIAAKDTYQSLFVIQKMGIDTFVRFHYTTTETPISAKIKITVKYRLTNGGFMEVV